MNLRKMCLTSRLVKGSKPSNRKDFIQLVTKEKRMLMSMDLEFEERNWRKSSSSCKILLALMGDSTKMYLSLYVNWVLKSRPRITGQF